MKKKRDAIEEHRRVKGKIEIRGRASLKTIEDWNVFYTPGVGAVSSLIAKHPKEARALTMKGNTVAVISDGSAVLGLGDIGPLAALPVLEGKALIFKECAGIDAFPIALGTKNVEEIVSAIKALAPSVAAINLEDISAPRCFEIEKRLVEELDMPVMHDDQHGTAVVVLAGLINACKVTKRSLNRTRIVVNGIGAAGTGVIRLLHKFAPRAKIIGVDKTGIIHQGKKNLHETKKQLLKERAIAGDVRGNLIDALKDADIFLGLSRGNIMDASHVRAMRKNAIVFALANPVPEIMPEEAKRGGAMVVATGRSDFPNQVNNALAFPGIFRGALDHGIRKITPEIKIRAAKALASLIKRPTEKSIIPSVLDRRVVPTIARAIR